MIAISLPPLTAHASASERMVLLNGLVMMLPALRSQMNSSAGSASAFGKKAFRRGSMHVSATTGNSSAKLRRMQSGAGITGDRAVIRVNDGFKEAHKIILSFVPALRRLDNVPPLLQTLAFF